MRKGILAAERHVRPRVKCGVLLIAVLTVLCTNAFADIYKWVGKDGKVYYSDKPPQDVKIKREQIKPAGVPDRSDKGELQRLRLLEQAKEKADRRIEKRRARAAAEKTARKARLAQEKRCLEARKQLAVLQERRPVYRDESGKFRIQWVNDTYRGKREYLDDAMRASGIERMRQEIVTYCQNPDDAEKQKFARKKWIMSERCATARAELEAAEQPRARAPRQELEEKRKMVKMFCTE